jgi:hypothetical protein
MADLTITITEDLTINSVAVGSTNAKTITDIVDVYKRTVKCTNGQITTICNFGETEYAGNGTFNLGQTKYIRVTNLDSTNSVELAFILFDGVEEYRNCTMSVKAGESYLLFSAEECMDTEADGVPSFGALIDLNKIQARPIEAADVRLEVFIAAV